MFGACVKRFEEAKRKSQVVPDDDEWNYAPMRRIVEGTQIATHGRYDKAYRAAFESLKVKGEKLLHSYACYLFSYEPIMGTLYISNKRFAFCTDYFPTHYSSSSSPNSLFACYEVVIRNEKLRTVNPCTDEWNHSEKCIHIVSRNGHEFWFMGFTSYDKALKNLIEATYTHSVSS
ncbi:GEM-like protein 1 [Humulus lupulus]|uniref:GEM-like protein 1 n=1 Tax=Humulus lupulus TaxID=3486 RepID=UPI002B408E8D|nr:GEM-like protein 1 [Humulus lupulus]